MRVAVLMAALVTTAFVGAGCTAYTHPLQSSFFSKFSLRELVERNKSRSGWSCSNGGIGGGGGGGGAGGKGFRFHKGESLSCRLDGGGEKFDEASFIAALKEDVEGDLGESGAKITDRGAPNVSAFSFEYEHGAGRGRVEITGRRIRDEYYSLKAELDERDKSESQ